MKTRKRTKKKAGSSSIRPKSRQVLDCVLLPPPRRFNLKQTKSDSDSTARGTPEPQLSQSEGRYLTNHAEAVEDARSVTEKQTSTQTGLPEGLRSAPPAEPTQTSWPPLATGIGLITPAPSVDNLAPSINNASPPPGSYMWNTREASPRPSIIDLTDAMEVDEIPAGPEELIGAVLHSSSPPISTRRKSEQSYAPDEVSDVAMHAEDPAEVEPPPPTLRHPIEQEEFPGFQLLDPSECIMVPWTKVSMCETSLYVPAALGDLIQQMRQSLETEQTARMKAEERLLSLILVRSDDELKLSSAAQEIESLRKKIWLLEKENRDILKAAPSISPLKASGGLLTSNSPTPDEPSPSKVNTYSKVAPPTTADSNASSLGSRLMSAFTDKLYSFLP